MKNTAPLAAARKESDVQKKESDNTSDVQQHQDSTSDHVTHSSIANSGHMTHTGGSIQQGGAGPAPVTGTRVIEQNNADKRGSTSENFQNENGIQQNNPDYTGNGQKGDDVVPATNDESVKAAPADRDYTQQD